MKNSTGTGFLWGLLGLMMLPTLALHAYAEDSSSSSSKEHIEHMRAKHEHDRCLVKFDDDQPEVVADFRALADEVKVTADTQSSGSLYCADPSHAGEVLTDLQEAGFKQISWGGSYQELHEQTDSMDID
ncbi:hypothetical protein ACKC9G_08480 [Pokkaliibacter sp. CJK22405]|uniref:hypothetical protein n=1 Tax=Pokkaliibacter sp. CJK22405 TaxID=3384615 RepID=UPI0039848D5F